MRPFRLTALCVATVGLLLCDSAAGQFNPEGRKRTRPSGSTARTPRPARPNPATARPKEPSKAELIARYRAIVLAQPSAAFPLQRLADLYRERDGNLDKLIEEFEGHANKPDAYAATVALGGIYLQAQRHDQAIAAYQRAKEMRPKAPQAALALAGLQQQRGEAGAAYSSFAEALPNVPEASAREQIRRTLMQLALDLERYDDAEKHHRELVKSAKGSLFARGELGRELLQRGKAERAVAAFESVVKHSAGDSRATVPALRELGQAHLAANDAAKAVATLERARRLLGDRPGEERELLGLLASAYRAQGKLAEFVKKLEKSAGNSALELEQLGRLHEEVGRLDDALASYRKALKLRPRDIDTRLKVIRLLQLRGELDVVIKEYRALLREAPRNAEYVFQLAEALLARGERDAALAELRKLEARARGDEDILAGLVNFYERLEENDHALTLLKQLARGSTRDPHHLIELGNRYFRDNETERAKQTWLRIRNLIPNPAEAAQRLGEIYLEHDLKDEALASFRKAVELAPKEPRYRKSLALALQRIAPGLRSKKEKRALSDEARKIWQKLLETSGDSPRLARQAREQLVSSWHLDGSLKQRITPLERKFEGPPADAEAGRLLAEVWLKLGKPDSAAKTLEQVVTLEPGDVQSLDRLQRAYTKQRLIRKALLVLEKLTRAQPKRAREHYQRMAKLAADIYDDSLALKYARRVVELNPSDSESHRRLAELYARTQQFELAIPAYQNAILHNDRSFITYLELADLFVAQERPREAARLLERVVTSSPDDQLVARATRTSLQIHLGQDSLSKLEQVLLPQTLAHPGRPIFRRLLVELYGSLALPLAHTLRQGSVKERLRAAEELRRIGKRATKPLLDALSDSRQSQRKIALELLRYVENPSAGPALIAFARDAEQAETRRRAMAAIVPMKSPALLPRLEEVLFPTGTLYADDSDPLVSGAARAVALMQHRRARPLLSRMISSESPVLRGWACLGLALLGGRSAPAQLLEAAETPDYGSLSQAAALYALGRLGIQTEAQETLLSLVGSRNELVKANATWSLAKMRVPDASQAIAELLLSESPELREVAVASAIDWAAQSPAESEDWAQRLLLFDGELREWLASVPPSSATPEDAHRSLVALAPALTRVATIEVKASSERALFIAKLLVDSSGSPHFSPLSELVDGASPELGASSREAARGIGKALVPTYIGLASHPAMEIRVAAIRFLASQSGREIASALAGILAEGKEATSYAALGALRMQPPSAATILPVVKLLQSDARWPLRVRAAESLANMNGAASHPEALQALVDRLENDEVAWVREAAAKALAKSDQVAARATLQRQSRRDPEPRVRAALRALLGSSP